jgi:predicted ATPase/DNA-binding NarL/FixJ family response regulator
MGLSSNFLPNKDGDYPMTETMTHMFICPKLVGRQLDLTALHMLIDRKNSGQGQMILISGEAGIGKSRLVTETKIYAAQSDFLLLEGQCFQTDSAYPYAPLLDLFRSYFARYAPTSLAENMHPFVSTLSHLLPDLALLFPDLATIPAQPSIEPEEEKRRLFAAMTHFFTEQAAQQPVLLVVEDVHWCDDLSLDFLLHLIRRCRNVPLLFLVTYRSDELHPRLKKWLTHLDRERVAHEFSLVRLSRSDVAAMLDAMLVSKQGVDDNLVGTLSTLSEGNPFVVEELLKSLMTTGELVNVNGTWKLTVRQASIPWSLQDAVRQRTERLSADARRLLLFAAVAGRRFNVALLQQVLRYDEAHLLPLLKELMAAQLVMEESADQFAFRHALTQQAIYRELLVRERQVLHRSIAETLEHLSTSSLLHEKYLEDLAYHCYEAGIWEQAMAYAQEVGEKALTLYAQQAAIDHLSRAVDAAHHLSQTPPAQLYQARGQAYETLGDFDRARGDYERALETATTAHQSNLEWQSMLSLGFLWTGRDYDQAGVWFRKALDLADELGDFTLRARSLNRLGNWLANTGQAEEGVQAHHEALRTFETLQDTQGMAETLDLLGMAYGFSGDSANSVKHHGRAVDLFRTLNDHQSLLSSLAGRAIHSAPEAIETTYSALRTRDECVQDTTEALRLARQTNSQTGEAFVEIVTTQVYFSFGEFGPALTHAQEAMRIATAIEHQQWMIATYNALGQLYILMLEPALAISALEAGLALSQTLGSAFWIRNLTSYLALGYMLRQEIARADAALKTIMPRERKPGDLAERQIARIWGELALVQGEPRIALQITEYLLASTPGEQRSQPIPHLLKLKGEALVMLSRFEEAENAFENAKRGALARHAPSVLWHVHRSFGHLYHRLKREELAQREYTAARLVIEALAATIDETALQEHFLRTALASIPQGKSLSPQAITRSMYGGLSAREREVTRLIAQGTTNREIASRLVVSERTAEAHVSSILGKLGFTSRTQIVAWAIEKELHHP